MSLVAKRQSIRYSIDYHSGCKVVAPKFSPRNFLLWSPEDHLGKSVDDVFGIPITGTNTPNNPSVV